VRVKRLELTGIGPFRHQQVIDFAQLSESGLFLIDGPTGAGKTTIIDAIVFALFSGLSGESTSKERIRSDHALGNEKSEVILDFSVQGRQHRITRSPAYAAAKANGEGFTNKPAKQSLTEYHTDGSVKTTLTSATDIGVHVSRLLNMQAQQFRQLVVLAQGEFAALLRMKPKERLEALRGLLGTEFYQDLQAVIAEEGTRSREVLAQARKELQVTATQAEVFIDEFNRAELDPHFEILRDVDVSPEQRSNAFTRITEILSMDSARLEKELALARTELEPVEKEFTATAHVIEMIEDIDQALAAVAAAELGLDPMDAGILPVEAQARSQSLTIEAGALQPLAEWESQTQTRTEKRKLLAENVTETSARVVECEAELAQLPTTLDALRKSLATLPAVSEKLRSMSARLLEINDQLELIDQLREAQQIDSQLAIAEKSADAELSGISLSLEQARGAVTALLNQQLEQRVAVLSQALIDGQPCKVCGSTVHPEPAHTEAVGAVVTEEEVQLAEQAVSELVLQYEVVVVAVENARKEHQESALAVAQLQGQVGVSTAESLAQEKVDVSQVVAELEGEVDRLTESQELITRLESELENGTANLLALNKAHADALKEMEFFDQQVTYMMSKIFASVGNESSVTAQHAILLERAEKLSAFGAAHTTLKERERTLTTEVTDIGELTARFEKLTETRQELMTKVKSLSDSFAIAESAAQSMDTLKQSFQRQMKKNEKLEAKHGPAIRLAGIVTAQSPQNVKKLPLESYALQLRFHHVLEAASHHLDKMSSGRLSFVLDQESQSNAQAGLGIDIVDSWTGESRPPASLSGGETFYASLSLALGLADVVHAETGGVSLETLFVDEGFGSLDQETLQVVLDQLENLKSGGRVIGVISHVSEMKDRFPERLMVEPQPDGTSVVVQEVTS
jgi:exonuclease SbcC